MTSSRYLLTLLGALALSGATALAAPPAGVSVGVGAGAHGGVGVGAPPLGVPPAHVPPLTVPPVSVPKPQTNVPPANANSNATLNANTRTNASLAGGSVMHGTITAINGTSVTVQQSNGTTQTYTVSSQTAAQLASRLNKTIAFRVKNGTLALVGVGTPPLHGTLLAVNGTTAQIKLANGTTQTYTVTSQQAAWLRAHAGKSVAFWTAANGTIELNQNTHRKQTAHRTTRRPHTH